MAEKYDVVVTGAGIGGLTTACLLAHKGLRVLVLERNWLPGGCVSSYPRKHFIFEAGATTLIGLEKGMPLRHLLDTIGVEIPAVKLRVPMQVHFADGEVLTRHEDLNAWIGAAEKCFGVSGQRQLWEKLKSVSDFVWDNSLRQRAFPPRTFRDLITCASHASAEQVRHLPLAWRTTSQLIAEYKPEQAEKFKAFCDEQLLITAQNHGGEVNALFGAAALCYTHYPNYYVMGGMINLVRPLVNYLSEHGGVVKLRETVKQVKPEGKGYQTETDKGLYESEYFVSGIPLNNTLEILGGTGHPSLQRKKMQSVQLTSAFSMGIVIKRRAVPETLHHQIHLGQPLPETGSQSIFVSLSHPEDRERCGAEEVVMSVSTHIPDPHNHPVKDKALVEETIFAELEKHGLLKREDVVFYHSSTQKSWEKWTGRQYGFVGGYPQYKHIKPWQMQDARIDYKGAYICGDSTYPGQGIPGACLSGILAFEKLSMDHLR